MKKNSKKLEMNWPGKKSSELNNNEYLMRLRLSSKSKLNWSASRSGKLCDALLLWNSNKITMLRPERSSRSFQNAE